MEVTLQQLLMRIGELDMENAQLRNITAAQEQAIAALREQLGAVPDPAANGDGDPVMVPTRRHKP